MVFNETDIEEIEEDEEDEGEDFEGVEAAEETGEAGEDKAANKKSLVLLQDFGGYCIYGSSCFVIKKPGGAFGGYFTTLGGCVREISKLMLVEKAGARDRQMKKNVDSLIGLLEQHDATVERLIAEISKVTVDCFKEDKPKRVKKGKTD